MVIMGGANLSQNYFLNRRDRYLLIRHHPELCDYLFDYLAVVVENCPIGANRSHKNNLERHFKLWKYGYTPEEYKSSIYEQERELDLREA